MTLISLVSALPLRENQVQLTFSEPPYFSNVLDLGDASDATLYTVTPVAGGIGLDGSPVRAVLPMLVEAGTLDTQLNVWFDRTMSCFPCQYQIAVANIKAKGGDALDPSNALVTFSATRWFFTPPGSQAHQRRDIANPQSFSGLTGTGTQSQSALGTYVVDTSADYSFDQGLESLKKRIYRRCITKLNGFAHLPGYGIGLPYLLKRLATSVERARAVGEAQKQISSEPDVLKCKVLFTQLTPGLFRMTVLVRTVQGLDAKFAFDSRGVTAPRS